MQDIRLRDRDSVEAAAGGVNFIRLDDGLIAQSDHQIAPIQRAASILWRPATTLALDLPVNWRLQNRDD